MKKKILALLMALFSVCTMSAGDGLYVGVGGAYQSIPLLDGTTHNSVAPAVELGYNYGYFGFGAAASFAGNMMFAADVHTNLAVTEECAIVLGCGYGAIYRKTKCPVDDCDYEIKGFIDWPHADLGVDVSLTDNFGLRIIGALGYGRSRDDYNHDYYYSDYDSHGYYRGDWRFAAQVRAMLVWTF